MSPLHAWFKSKRHDAPNQSQQVRPAVIKARYDAAQTTRENMRHWVMADSCSADQSASPEVRRKLRERARYEVANNSYAKGIVLTIANDCIGTGPRLQVLTEDDQTNRKIENAFSDWSQSVNLAEKLRTMRMAKTTDGEVFAVLAANPKLDSPVQMDVQLIETERVASPQDQFNINANDVDGIQLNRLGIPESYTVLRNHSAPGAPGSFGSNIRRGFDVITADSMIHWFRMDRPDQHRGVPEITPALPLFAQLRRYTLAVIAAAETAADFAAVLYTDAPANGEAQALEPMDVIDLEKRMATVLPDGWRLGQVSAQQPTTTYAEFKREILNEIARCLNLPYNIAACNSSGYNYASGRLDHQTYYKSIRVEQADLVTSVLDPILHGWIHEGMLTTELNVLRRLKHLPHQWFFDGTEHVDPAKEANAQATRLKSCSTTLAAEYARQGKDWEIELRQRAKEKNLMRELGLTESDGSTETGHKESMQEQNDDPSASENKDASH
ncbi:Phage portal protein, lambda family [Poriferisphaera corsica]|uniref:Phage portal protein, lambda family n=1 Tax=Poriferisphaera corsica TaxID=2528020 RepID=A0A517YS51_9BACT|nr:phage portal protein [Poriferisphaera corsica]QDU33041.1 Phage portal protein, lambda family [Poriferisphaera corsica]